MQQHNMSHAEYLTLQYQYNLNVYFCTFRLFSTVFVRASVVAVGTVTAPQN